MTYDRCMDVAVAAAKKAGLLLMDYIKREIVVEEKSSAGDLVTEADRASEGLILSMLLDAFPQHPVIGEESGFHAAGDKAFLWAVDPLDGTTNFTHHVPNFAVSIALIKRDLPVVGVIYNPAADELFTAIIGEGAYLNGKRISVSTTATLDKSLLATGFAYDRRETPDNNYAEFCYITSLTQGVRRMGSAALDLAYVSCGRFDGFWERGLNIWDIAAGILLVTEAGGAAASYENGPLKMESGRVLATNGKIQIALSQSLQHIHAMGKPIFY